MKVFSSNAVTGDSLKDVFDGFLKDTADGGYVAINAYLPRNSDMIDVLQVMRAAIRAKTGNAVTAGFGPRFQHSTGQFHKGGIKDGLFIVVTTDYEKDMDVPTQGLTFGTLLHAQALGDYEALIEAEKKVLRIHLPSVDDAKMLVDALQ